MLVGRYVSVVFDCDRAGREAAARIAGDLKAAGVRGSVIDLARERQSGYDLTDWLNARRVGDAASAAITAYACAQPARAAKR